MALPIKITDAGKQAIINAQNTGTAPVTLTQLALGTGNYDPSTAGGMTALVSEFKRINLTSGQVVAADTIHVVAEDTSADAYTVNEIGLYTDGGVLFAVYSVTSGDITAKAAGAIMLLVADILLTDVSANSITFGNMDFVNPPATETVQGVAKVATQALVDAGTDDTTMVTPKKAHARFADLRGAAFTGRVQINGAADDGSTALQVNGSGLFGGLLKVTQASGLQNLLIGNQDGTGANRPGIIQGVNGSIVIGFGNSWSGTGGTLTPVLATAQAGAQRVLIAGASDNGTDALQVNGSILSDSHITIASANPFINFNSSSSGAHSLQLTNTGTALIVYDNSSAGTPFSVTNSGRVLIGTTTDNGTDALQVAGSISATNVYIKNQATTDAGTLGFSNSNGPGIQLYGTGTGPAGAMLFTTNGSERLRISGAGRVLIGTTTDNGSDALQVAGSGSFSGKVGIGTSAGAITAPGNAGNVLEVADATQAALTIHRNGAGHVSNFSIIASYDTAPFMAFYDAVAAAERMRLSGAGRLLIGTTTDNGTDALQVAGTGYFSAANCNIRLHSTGTSDTGIQVEDANGKNWKFGLNIGGVLASGFNIWNFNNNNSPFGISSAGRVLIGNGGIPADNGADALQVAGTISANTPPQFDTSTKVATMAALQRALGNFQAVTAMNAATTLTAAQSGTLFEITASGFTITLPAPAGNTGIVYDFFCGGNGNATLATPSGNIYNSGNPSTSINLPPYSVTKIVSDGTNWVQLTGAGRATLGNPGYQRLDSGLIIQWGYASLPNTNSSATSTTVTLPIAFPNGMTCGVASCGQTANSSAGGRPVTQVNTANNGASIFIALDTNGSTTINQVQWANWVAIGF